MSTGPLLEDEAALALLGTLALEPVGVLTEASNLTMLVDLVDPDTDGSATGHQAVYKPVRGERPLTDFPAGTLAAREVAAYLVSKAGGWDLVPPTLLREGPLGPGSVQWWVRQTTERLADPSAGLVEVLPPDRLGPGWLGVVSGTGAHGEEVVVAHADDPELRSMAVLDAVLTNADRKAAHLTRDVAGRLRGFDHGLCLHVDDKLRTVLWGWAGEPLRDEDRTALGRLQDALDDPPTSAALAALLAPEEVDALAGRTEELLASGTMPLPPGGRYPLPWPLW